MIKQTSSLRSNVQVLSFFVQVDEASERRAPTFAQQCLRMAEAGVSFNGAFLEIWGVLTKNVKIIR